MESFVCNNIHNKLLESVAILAPGIILSGHLAFSSVHVSSQFDTLNTKALFDIVITMFKKNSVVSCFI